MHFQWEGNAAFSMEKSEHHENKASVFFGA